MRASDLTVQALLDRALREDAIVVAPTVTAAAGLRRAFATARIGEGLDAWKPPRILSWTQWTSAQWTPLVLAGHEDRLLLNQAQERHLWAEILADVPGALNATVSPASVATLAQTAWRLACDYQVVDGLRRSAVSHDPRLFAEAARRFAAQCQTQRLLSPALLEAVLADHLTASKLQPPARLLLCEAGSRTPAQTHLLAALESAGAAIEHVRIIHDDAPAQVSRAQLPDPATELRFALQRVRKLVAANPGSRATLIVPDGALDLAELEPALRAELAPELNDIEADPALAPWNLSGGPALHKLPAIAALLNLARWMRGTLPVGVLSGLLRSPFLTPLGETSSRARFDTAVLSRQFLLRPELDLHTTARLAVRFPELHGWLQRLQAMAGEWNATPARRTYAAWTDALRRLAAEAGWPGPRSPNAAEQAALDAFDSVLDLTATLDFAGQRVSSADALQAIEQQAASTSVPTGSAEAPVQVLTLSQARGLHFDFAVVLRATDGNLPLAARPHPLLEWTLQRSLRMPGTTPEITEAATREVLEALLASTPKVLFTHAERDDDGELRVSPLACSFAPNTETVSEDDLPADPPAPVVEEILAEDDVSLPHPPAEVRGGASALRLQSACGFLAFAQLRLGGRDLEQPQAGLSPAEAGTLLHAVLNAFWDDVRTQAALAAQTEQQREDAIDRALEAALFGRTDTPLKRERSYHSDNRWDQAFLSVTRERLRRLLRQWLRFESERGPFTVLALEEKSTIGVGPLFLDVRMDRVDSVPDGNGGHGVVFVDYKTGEEAGPVLWEGPRPDDPQLPLYALNADPESVAGVTFARIRPGASMGYTGWTSAPNHFSSRRVTVRDIATGISDWRQDLEALAWDFYEGKAAVDPKSYHRNCKRCSQRLLCRVDAAALLVREELEESAGEEDGGADG